MQIIVIVTAAIKHTMYKVGREYLLNVLLIFTVMKPSDNERIRGKILLNIL